MAMVIRRYNTMYIVQERRIRASTEATGCRHWVSIAADDSLWTSIRHFFQVFSSSTCYKKDRDDAKAPNNNRGMTYQSNGKELCNMM